MPSADFSLKEPDRKRFIKDRIFRLLVSFGGVGVLMALVLIFVYLALVVLPLFSDANIETGYASNHITTASPISIGVDEYGEHAFVLSQSGQLDFWSLDDSPSAHSSFSISDDIVLTASDRKPSGWQAVMDKADQLVIFKPRFSNNQSRKGRAFIPNLEFFENSANLNLHRSSLQLTQFDFSLVGNQLTLVGLYDDDRVMVRWNDDNGPQEYIFNQPLPNLDQLIVTPNGNMLYMRTGSELIVALKRENDFVVREVVDLSLGNQKHAVSDVNLLSGAYSLLVTHQDGLVSQWFDVLTDKERKLTHIREFELASELEILLPDSYRKGFYSFYTNGTLQSHHTTSEKLVMFTRAFSKAPSLVAMSNNEKYLLTLSDDRLDVALVNNEHPEISFSSLWKKVWYESYPEPEFTWQTTSANDDFEAKFSLVPIAFGTLKAAAFAMLFAVPIAVLGAIYTAYFMSESMRRVVKPSIELMEAFPTVIIGFLAGLWFAPIVESYLSAVVALLILLPLSTLVVGVVWHVLPSRFVSLFPNGWHSLILMPVLVCLVVVIMSQSAALELWLFNGDVRIYLANHGIGFDQRNALVVGFAMGFAVIPTIFTIAEDAVFSVPKHLSDGSLALGATPWQTLLYVVLLTASPGIFSAIMMGLGRAVGETMIVLMATGNTPILDWNILEGMRTLSATIAVEMPESEVASTHYRLLFLAALLLLIFTFAVNSIAEWVRQRLRERYRAL
ncbi:ABC transporter permease subunit [Vibrio genomosp. F10]|uniref:ABC transporter permease subunit n=1 Tax=Vibrio genomosp. F10 TaxID=723171 RepID=UPI0002F63616|nr:ABC transporter permease subunit [Vibrio genomosp. F10]OEF09078.1 phosphate ABC transporter permease [Vibrio genomosp. F10 str. 9ZB36]